MYISKNELRNIRNRILIGTNVRYDAHLPPDVHGIPPETSPIVSRLTVYSRRSGFEFFHQVYG